MTQESRYRDFTLALMVELAGWTDFSNIERIADVQQRADLLIQARAAVERLSKLTKQYGADVANAEQVRAEIDNRRRTSAKQRLFEQEHDRPKDIFTGLAAATDVHQRGKAFERFLRDLFTFYGLEPRIAYAHDSEQIDGALTFDTDDYIMEARWRSDPVSRADVDVFAGEGSEDGQERPGLL